MIKFKQFSTNEKAMIIILVTIIIAIALQWKTVIKGVKKGLKPYKNEQSIKNN